MHPTSLASWTTLSRLTDYMLHPIIVEWERVILSKCPQSRLPEALHLVIICTRGSISHPLVSPVTPSGPSSVILLDEVNLKSILILQGTHPKGYKSPIVLYHPYITSGTALSAIYSALGNQGEEQYSCYPDYCTVATNPNPNDYVQLTYTSSSCPLS